MDFLILLQAGLSQAFREKINGIDLFIFYNPEHPFGKNKNLKKFNDKDKILSRIFNIMPLVEFNATVDTDNLPALNMYRKLGFKESTNYLRSIYQVLEHL
jgi:hypothetical protein